MSLKNKGDEHQGFRVGDQYIVGEKKSNSAHLKNWVGRIVTIKTIQVKEVSKNSFAEVIDKNSNFHSIFLRDLTDYKEQRIKNIKNIKI